MVLLNMDMIALKHDVVVGAESGLQLVHEASEFALGEVGDSEVESGTDVVPTPFHVFTVRARCHPDGDLHLFGDIRRCRTDDEVGRTNPCLDLKQQEAPLVALP